MTALHATVSTIYTVLLAFVVVIVWQQLTDAGARVETEATRLSNILRDAQALTSTDEVAIRTAVHDYIEVTSTREWDRMAEGKDADPVSQHRLRADLGCGVPSGAEQPETTNVPRRDRYSPQ